MKSFIHAHHRKFVIFASLLFIASFMICCARNEGPTVSSNHSTGIQWQPPTSWVRLEAFAQDGCSFQGTPIKGSTNQGGYAFEYESRDGTGPSGACRWYGLRNIPGKLYTPAKWRDSDETFMDTALPECKPGTTCPWITVVRHSLRTADGKTILSYGVNKNEYSDDPSAFKKHPDEKAIAFAGDSPPLITTISGVIADAEQRPLEISIRLISNVKGKAPPYTLAYEIQTGPRAPWLSIGRAEAVTDIPIRVMWGAASSQAFQTAVQQDYKAQVSGAEKTLAIEFLQQSIRKNDRELFTISQGDTVIFATSAPAYGPGEPK